eukprot:402679-Hanusia_phi.AAC.1
MSLGASTAGAACQDGRWPTDRERRAAAPGRGRGRGGRGGPRHRGTAKSLKMRARKDSSPNGPVSIDSTKGDSAQEAVVAGYPVPGAVLAAPLAWHRAVTT